MKAYDIDGNLIPVEEPQEKKVSYSLMEFLAHEHGIPYSPEQLGELTVNEHGEKVDLDTSWKASEQKRFVPRLEEMLKAHRKHIYDSAMRIFPDDDEWL